MAAESAADTAARSEPIATLRIRCKVLAERVAIRQTLAVCGTRKGRCPIALR